MNDFIGKNKQFMFIALSALMFIFFAFCPAIDILGKAKFNGIKVIFDASGLGFSRFMGFLMLLVPIFVLVKQFVQFNVSEKIKENIEVGCFGLSFFFFLIFWAALPTGANLAIGSILYALFAVLGILICVLPKLSK